MESLLSAHDVSIYNKRIKGVIKIPVVSDLTVIQGDSSKRLGDGDFVEKILIRVAPFRRSGNIDVACMFLQRA